MTVRAAWLLPGGTTPGQTREDTRLTPVGTYAPTSELGTRDGVIAGGDPFAATGAGAMTLQIGVGRSIVQGTVSQGAYPVAVTAPETLTFGDGHAQFARIDSVILHVYDGLYDASGQTLAAVEILSGEPSATPTAPLLPSGSLRLWDVTVPAGVSAGTGGIDWPSALADRRRYTAAYGGIIPRAALSDAGAYDGQYADVDGTLYRWSAAETAWNLYRPPTETTETRTSGLTAASGWAVTSYYARRRGGVVSFTCSFTRSGADLSAGDNLGDTDIGTLPAGWRPLDEGFECVASTGYGDGAVNVYGSGLMRLRTWTANGIIRKEHNLRVSGAFVQ